MLPVGVGTQLLAAWVVAGQAWHDGQGEGWLSAGTLQLSHTQWQGHTVTREQGWSVRSAVLICALLEGLYCYELLVAGYTPLLCAPPHTLAGVPGVGLALV